MTQAIHIFRKDLRRMWPQIAMVMLAIGYFVSMAFNIQVVVFNVVNGTSLIEPLICATVWFLIAGVVHEESLPGDNEFWLTRPYRRESLLAAKAMMAVFVVAVPLFVADCVILGALSLPVGGSLGGLVVRQLITSAWLILPPFAIASVTSSLTQDVMAWVAGIGIAAAAYFPDENAALRVAYETYAIPVAVAMLLVVVWRQYRHRSTWPSRGMIVAAVLLPALPFPQGASFAMERALAVQAPAAQGITLVASAERAEESEEVGFSSNRLRCATIAFAVTGARPGWRMKVLAAKSSFDAGGERWSSGWGHASGWTLIAASKGSVNACTDASGVKALSGGKQVAARVDLALAVIADDATTTFPVQPQPFDVPDVGRCRFREFSWDHRYSLNCQSPVWFPHEGNVVATTEDVWMSRIVKPDYPWTPWGLLPGLSPVFGWNTLPFDAQIREAMAKGGKVEFRTEKQIALIEREVSVGDVRFLAAQ